MSEHVYLIYELNKYKKIEETYECFDSDSRSLVSNSFLLIIAEGSVTHHCALPLIHLVDDRK